MNVRYSRRAARDLVVILSYVAERSTGGAVRFDASIQRDIEFISRNPLAGKKTAQASLLVSVVRGYPCKIFYRTRADLIEIVHIRHASRRPWRELL